MPSPSVQKILDEIAKRKAALLARDNPAAAPVSNDMVGVTAFINGINKHDNLIHTTDRHGNQITYNEKQTEAVKRGSNQESIIVIGAAGTGKTTCQRGITDGLIDNGKAGVLSNTGHKVLKDGTPGIVVCAFTRRAVANIAKNVSEDLRNNCLTIHALLEYEPSYYTIIDPLTGKEKKMMEFVPTRNRMRPLPTSIRTIVFEESSMIAVDLFNQVLTALNHKVQFIFLGDIQQLPPVFGPAILGYKMLELPVIELTEVYRQALESPILRLAHQVLNGKTIEKDSFVDWHAEGKLKLHPWKKKISDEDATRTAEKFFTTALTHGAFNPDTDVILIPYNKGCGTIELNKGIANFLTFGKTPTFEIIAGFNRHYLAVGDKVLVNKEDASIISISRNGAYIGATPQHESLTLDRWGFDSSTHKEEEDPSDEDVDAYLAKMAASTEKEDRVNQASHIVRVRFLDGTEDDLDTAKDINDLLLGYALTVHKAQGSEWKKVFLVFHQSHAKMVSRELLYTAITRAKEELYIICEPETFVNGINSQRIKGNTLEEKAEYFKGKPMKQLSFNEDSES